MNNRGERFVAEDSYHSRTSAFVFDQPEQKAWLILDSAHMAEPAYGFQPLVDGWETVAEMEAGLGVPEGSLARTLEEYNAAAREGDDPAFHKAAEYVAPLDSPPYGAYDLTPGRASTPGSPAAACGSTTTAGCCARTAPPSTASTPPGPAPPTSRSTARATLRAPSSAKRRSSAVAPGVTQP